MSIRSSLVTTTACLAMLFSASALAQNSELLEPIVRPAEQHDLVLSKTEDSKSFGLENETLMFLSVRIVETEGEKPVVLRGHTRDVPPSKLVQPQGGLGTVFTSTLTRFHQIRGKNVRVEVLTPGTPPDRELDGIEIEVRERLKTATYIEQLVIPAVSYMAGKWIGSETMHQNLVVAIINSNKQLFADLDELVRRGDHTAIADLLLNVITSDIQSGGPISQALGDVVVDAIQRRIALRVVATGFPKARIALAIYDSADFVLTLTHISKAVTDLRGTPGLVTFHVYFHAGIGGLTPTWVRAGEEGPQSFWIHGYGLDLARSRGAKARLHDEKGNLLAVAKPKSIAADRIQVEFPRAIFVDCDDPLSLRLQIGDDTLYAHEPVRVVLGLDAFKVDPARGRVGEVVKIECFGVRPYFITTRVYFGEGSVDRHRARIVRLDHDAVRVEVPPMANRVERDIAVWIEEDASDFRRTERLPFRLLQGTFADHAQERRGDSMPESTRTLKGVLAEGADSWTQDIPVQSGMQIRVRIGTLAAVAPEESRAPIERFALGIENPEDGKLIEVGNGGPGRIRPGSSLTHTTNGANGMHRYRIELGKASGPATRFEIICETVARDDLGSGRDAHGDPADGPWILNYRSTLLAHLYGGRRVFGEDLRDEFLIPRVSAGQTVQVTIESVGGDLDGGVMPVLGSARLYVQRADPGGGPPKQFRIAEELGIDASMDPLVLAHTCTQNEDLLLRLDHGAGNVAVRFRVDVDHGGPAAAAVTSDFEGENRDDWMLSSPDSTGTMVPTLAKGKVGADRTTWLESVQSAPAEKPELDLVLVIDTTGSMGPYLKAVLGAAETIVGQLGKECSKLRLGLVGYGDQEHSKVPFRVSPLSDDPVAQLRTMADWVPEGGGRDVEEDLLEALSLALKLDWKDSGDVARRRAIVTLTDAPAKMASGKDFAGNTIERVRARAREAGVMLQTICLRLDAKLLQQAQALANGNRGAVMTIADAQSLPQSIIDSASLATELQACRYWVAPRKFLGAHGPFYGGALSFRVSCAGNGRAFDADDIVLRSGTVELVFRGHLRPPEVRTGYLDDSYISVKLEPDAGWIDRTTGRVVGPVRMRAVLNTLSELRIRADYRQGPDTSTIDDINFGGRNKVTDRAPDVPTRGLLDAIDASHQSVLSLIRVVRDKKRLANRALQSMGEERDRAVATAHAEAAALQVRNGVADIEQVDFERRVIEHYQERRRAIRARGALSREERESIYPTLREEIGRVRKAAQLLKKLCDNRGRYQMCLVRRARVGTPAMRDACDYQQQQLDRDMRALVDEFLAAARPLAPTDR